MNATLAVFVWAALPLATGAPVQPSPSSASAPSPQASVPASAPTPEDVPTVGAEQDAPATAPATHGDVTEDAQPPVEPGLALEDLMFGDHLFADGDYYRAVTEYRRYLYKTRGQGEQSARAAVAIGEAYLRGAQYDAAALQLESVADRRTDATGQAVANLAAARAYLLDDRPLLARPRIRRIHKDADATPVLRAEAALLLGISYVQGENYSRARTYLEDPSMALSGRAPLAKALLKALRQRESLPQKSPIIAFVLSLVPGLGHFYLGQWAVGLTAALWNGLFTLGALDAWIQRSWGVAIILTILELTFYGGNIFGAVSGAFKYNRDQELNWRDAVRTQYEGVLRLPDPTLTNPPGSLLRLGVPLDVPVP